MPEYSIMASIPAGSVHIHTRNSSASAGCRLVDSTAAEEPPWAAEAYPSDHVGIGATAHLPSPSGTDSMSASDQEPEIVARASPSPAAAIHGGENAPWLGPTIFAAGISSQYSATRIEASSVMSTIQPSPSGRNHTAPACWAQAMRYEPSEGSRVIRLRPSSATASAVSRNSSHVDGGASPSSPSSTSRL